MNAVPLVWPFQVNRSIRHLLARSSVWLRRALLAAAWAVLCEEAHRVLTVGQLNVRFQHDLPALCDLLQSSVREGLLRRARNWPLQLRTELLGKVGQASSVYSLRQKSTNYGRISSLGMEFCLPFKEKNGRLAPPSLPIKEKRHWLSGYLRRENQARLPRAPALAVGVASDAEVPPRRSRAPSGTQFLSRGPHLSGQQERQQTT
jgi:hypothetical protein